MGCISIKQINWKIDLTSKYFYAPFNETKLSTLLFQNVQHLNTVKCSMKKIQFISYLFCNSENTEPLNAKCSLNQS